MSRVLVVDDDPLVLRIYRDGLARHGLEVDIAGDGLGAVRQARAARPDVVVLDLMMPRFTGMEVLKVFRDDPELAQLPVIILSSSHMDDELGNAGATGPKRALLKSQCTPSLLLSAIKDVLAEHSAAAGLASKPKAVRAAPAVSSRDSTTQSAQPLGTVPPRRADTASNPETTAARMDFLTNGPVICGALRTLFEVFNGARTDAERALRLQDLARKVHFVWVSSAMTKCHLLAEVAGVLEALLLRFTDAAALITPSVIRTITAALSCFDLLFRDAKNATLDLKGKFQALAVDDDPLSNRLVISSLKQVHIETRSTPDPFTAWRWLNEQHFDLVLLDIEMPGLNGLELGRRLRALPAYEYTPVIYVTSHGGFENRARVLKSGGDDVIGKPILSQELALKAIIHLVRRCCQPSQTGQSEAPGSAAPAS